MYHKQFRSKAFISQLFTKVLKLELRFKISLLRMSLARHCVHWGLHTRNWLLVNCDRQCIDHVSALSAAALQGGFEIGKCRRKITTHHWSVSFTRILRPRIFLWADDVGKIFRIFYFVTPSVKLLLYRSRIELG